VSGKAGLAALAAWRQGPDKFWAYHDLLFENQTELNDAKLLALAKAVGLDLKKWKSDRKDPSVKALFQQGQALGARAGLKGTPYVLINGRPLNNTVTSTDLAARIQLEMVRHRKECEE
jgi:protein-disulfide isomerase